MTREWHQVPGRQVCGGDWVLPARELRWTGPVERMTGPDGEVEEWAHLAPAASKQDEECRKAWKSLSEVPEHLRGPAWYRAQGLPVPTKYWVTVVVRKGSVEARLRLPDTPQWLRPGARIPAGPWRGAVVEEIRCPYVRELPHGVTALVEAMRAQGARR